MDGWMGLSEAAEAAAAAGEGEGGEEVEPSHLWSFSNSFREKLRCVVGFFPPFLEILILGSGNLSSRRLLCRDRRRRRKKRRKREEND